jgi:RNA polymerase sigma factor (sigma-70 family)
VPPEPPSLTNLVRSAAAGEQAAWDALVRRFLPLVRAAVRAQRVADADVPDVVQVVWIRLARSISTIDEPERIGAWLATTSRNEALRERRRRAHVLLDDDGMLEIPDDAPSIVALTEASEVEREIWACVGELSPACQDLLFLLLASPERSYAEVSAALDMPIGSIGPTRQRCLARLRRLLEDRGITDEV